MLSPLVGTKSKQWSRLCVKLPCQKYLLSRYKRRISYLTSNRNILKLNQRGIFANIFPDGLSPDLHKKVTDSSQGVYCGFDPTADSLHIGNLLAIIALLHCQRAGHQPFAVIGGATALIGDPSGKKNERTPLQTETIEQNVKSINECLKNIIHNHKTYFCSQINEEKMPEFKILNNASWYEKRNVIEFLASVGRHFRIQRMMSRESVKSRLSSQEGMCFTEFTYQLFQSYDWLHLFKNHNCLIQIGGNDQLGNITSGYEFISKVTRKTCFGLTVPLVKTLTGDKLGKTEGNAVWLNKNRTSPFDLYQFYFNRSDAEVENYLQQFTFICDEDIQRIMRDHKDSPHNRKAQKILAEHVTKLIHGEEGLTNALRSTDVLFKGSFESLSLLTESELRSLFKNAPTTKMLLEPGTTLKEVVMKSNCFANYGDADRIIKAGGVRVNYRVLDNPESVLMPGEHILPSKITLISVGKKNFYFVKWFGAGII